MRHRRKHGYGTACFGKWHPGYPEEFSPNWHGFDESLGFLGGAAELRDFGKDERGQVNLLSDRASEARVLKVKLADWELDGIAPRLRPFRIGPG